MARARDLEPGFKPEPLVISRTFAAPRPVVFKAWSTAEHIKRWFAPAGCSVPHAEIEFRTGGAFVVCMHLPSGEDHWVRGSFDEVSPLDRLGFTAAVSLGDVTRFTVRTAVTFEETADGTRMTVRQNFDIHDPAFLSAVEGSAEGWRTTLDKLERVVAGMNSAPSVVHATFSLERTFRASPTQVFQALSDQAAKARWFEGGAGWVALEREMDVRPGGRERAKGRWPSGLVTTFDAVYFDVVPNERLVYGYEMLLDDRKISVSLATIEIALTDAGTRLTVTEQGAFLDGYDDAGAREHGTGLLMDRLGRSLQGEAVT